MATPITVGAGGGFAVDPGTVFTASVKFLDTKDFVYNIADGLAGDLQTSAGMAGDDSTAHNFAKAYQPAATSILAGIGKAGQGMAAISSRLLSMAVNYLETENTISTALGSTIDVSSGLSLSPSADECDPNNASATLPMVTGSKVTHEIPVIGRFWPQGDSGKLRTVAQTWASAAKLIDEAQQNAAAQAIPINTECSGAAFDAFAQYAATIYTAHPYGGTGISPSLPLMENLSAACRLMAQDCRHVLEGLIAVAGLATIGGAVLTFFTFGASDEGAAAADAALAGEAAEAAAALEAGELSSAAASAVQEAEQIVAQLAARLLVTGGTVAAVGVITGAGSAQGATSPAGAAPATPSGSGAGAAAGSSPLIGPIPPPNPPVFPLYTPAQQAAAATWVAGLPQRPANYGTAADQAYQVRMAGSPEQLVTGADGSTVWADGYRPADGALIDAKNVRKTGCSPRTLDGLQQDAFNTNLMLGKDQSELGRYQQAIENPANHAQYLEVDTPDPATVGYWQFLLAQQHVTSNVRYVP